MQILCHRGLWRQRRECNTREAFRAAWEQGWGIETDVRDLAGNAVVSHDPPRGGVLTLDELLEGWSTAGGGTSIALNIKSDGLARTVAAACAGYDMSRLFVFDMSVPDQVAWIRAVGVALPVYSRWSDLEPRPVLLERAAGLWLDAFGTDGWWSDEAVDAHLRAGRRVAVVSPELHGREPDRIWARLRTLGLHRHPGMALCTDAPERAGRYFR